MDRIQMVMMNLIRKKRRQNKFGEASRLARRNSKASRSD